jgi:DNA-binding response OmpR family regulator
VIDSPDAIDTVTVLLVSSSPDDHRYFQLFSDVRDWRLCHAWTLARATELLRMATIPVIVVGEMLPDGEWLGLLESRSPESPHVIVTANYVGDRFCMEAANHVSFDMLARPFENKEVFRAITLGWLAWQLRARFGWDLEWERFPTGFRAESRAAGIRQAP